MKLLLSTYFFLIFSLSLISFGNDWKNWLGPNYDGSFENFEIHLPKTGQNYSLVWSLNVGEGWSSPIIYKNFLYFHDRIGTKERIVCIDKTTGKEKWNFFYESNYRDDFGMHNGPRSTPAIADNTLVSHGPQGLVHALSVESGRLLWKVDLKNRFNSSKGFFGRCSSPLITNGSVIFDVGGSNVGLISLCIKSGKVLWTSQKYGNDYSSCVPLRVKKQRLCIAFVREGLLALDERNGEKHFFAPFRSPIDASVNAVSPLVHNNFIFVSSCYDVGAGVWRFDENQKKSTFTFSEVWRSKGKLDCHYSTPVARDGFVYGFHGRQERKPVLRCINLTNADLIWEADPFGVGHLVCIKDKIVVLSERGELLIFKASPDKSTLLHRQQILGFDTRAHFAFSNGCIYARDKRRLVCFDLKKWD